MTHSSDDKNYVRAVLSYLGIDFDEADIVLSVCHCQSDELSFTCNITAIELKNAVDLYVDSISENEIEALNRESLKSRLCYFLEVFDAVSGQYLEISGKHFATSRFEYDDVCSEVLSMSNDVSQSKGYDRDEYNRLMQVDGQVMIARFALQQFWDTHFIGLITFVSESITSSLYKAYETFSDISLACYKLSEYSYSRSINSELTLNISLKENDFCEDLSDCYMEDEALPSGRVISRRNNDSIISIYESYAAASYIPMIASLEVVDEYGEVVTDLCHTVYVSELTGGRIKIHDRNDLVSEVFDNLRNLNLAVGDSVSQAA
ncbi:hypothetical protein ACY61_22975 [Salmonella enterica subsp. enterica serovar Saintpaul]|uniref:Uncharacterized protein n=11 Tax=Enterobacteriaceae TaxID=543 RepID=A0A2P9EI06_ECOLX|nr:MULTISPECIES: hypothetical protein [Enterobacteriaceae]EAA7522198.1 hypothetical protein [Salmonella enterica subsp. enterica serovar Montevideo]EAB9755357.1 hypothetical protein [Salmonella enterica subsp. enterica serovar Java]EBA2373661.1 hypothetical protein [Salmonella enterica subsp. enterica serovar Dublin]EBB7590396.1 hypothetical protein [Salmonella enterica subsp. enterica serovar Kentucky]EBD4525832.1 hypothetical protein [Salmonella enterica subsp. enterica serovar Ohio]EBF7520